MLYFYTFMTIFTPHTPGLNHVNLNGSNNNPLVLIIGIKSEIHVTQIWHLGLLHLLFSSYKGTICLSIHLLLNMSISKYFSKNFLVLHRIY